MPPKISYKHISTFAFLLGLTRLTAATVPDRITQPVDVNRNTTLTGNVQRQAQPQFDRGPVDPAMPMRHMVLLIQPSGAQQGELDQLMADQQNPSSARYRQWLSPEEFGDRFGLSRSDHSKVVAWLVSAGFTVNQSGRGRNWIAFSGTAGQVSRAFHTPIDRFTVNGADHYANTAPPSVPEALAGVVGGFLGLNNFRPHSMIGKITPEYTDGSTHYLAPQDWATIYDVAPLYQAGVNGAGQSIAVVGASDVSLPDIQAFRKRFGLPANDPQMVQYADDPGFNGAEIEGDLDLEWAGAIAPNATIYYVYGDDVFTAVVVAVDMNVAPVVTMSYGSCEIGFALGFWRAIAQQANAQGVTILNSSGDAGAAGCDGGESSAFAVSGLTVDFPASLPEVTGVGGTQFLDLTGTYWASKNSTDLGSALSYIPEAAWNESSLFGLAAGGGGASTLYSKPLWQTGPGVPNDNARHVPDIALNASDDHDPYLVYTGGSLQAYGGTSVPTPSFAGITALLNQHLDSGGVGNVNPKLYSLAQAGWASGMFHDVTIGNNIVTVSCGKRRPNCGNSAVGYYAGVGYDQTTGLGSVDAYRLVMGWNGASVTPPVSASLKLLSNLSTVAANDVVYLTATVTATDGITPSGSVVFSIGETTLGSAVLTGSAGTATGTLPVNGLQLPSGSGTITAAYNGASSASVTVNVIGSGSATAAAPAIASVRNGASFKTAFAPGGILSVFGSGLAPVTQAANSVPLPLSILGVEALVNGIVAPLYYVAPGQLNVQIPYETAANASATLSVNNNGQVTTQNFDVAGAAPGIFTNSSGALVPTAAAALGEEVAFYITGAGTVQPAISDGAAPPSSTAIANLPMPAQKTTVTIGGVNAAIDFIGIPWGLVGVTQINVQVPNGIASGAQPVVVTVGGVASAPATITITN